MLFTKILHLKTSPPPSPYSSPVSHVVPSTTEISSRNHERPPAGLSSSPTTHKKKGHCWTPPSVKSTRSSRETRRSAGLTSREYAGTKTPLKSLERSQKSSSNKNKKKSKTLGAQGHSGTAHILNTNSPQATANQEKLDLRHARMGGGSGSSRLAAERNLTTSNSFRALRAPTQQPPWTKAQMKQYLADAAAPAFSTMPSNLDQTIRQLQTEVKTLDARQAALSPATKQSASFSSSSSSSSSSSTTTTPSTSTASTNDEYKTNSTPEQTTPSHYLNYNFNEEERNQHHSMSPHDHVDAIKHRLNSRIRERQNHIANFAVAECSFIEGMPASRSVVSHPEYTRLSKQAYRFELDAQVRANRAREKINQVRAAKIAERSQNYLYQMSVARENNDNIYQAKQKKEIVYSLDKQISSIRKKKQDLQLMKEKEHRDLKYLSQALGGVTTHKEKLVEAHHESEQHCHLLKWQRMHREIGKRKSAAKARKKSNTSGKNWKR